MLGLLRFGVPREFRDPGKCILIVNRQIGEHLPVDVHAGGPEAGPGTDD